MTNTDKITLVEFFADWCGACKMQEPILEELKRNIGDRVDILKVNLADSKDIFNEFKVDATPTIFLIRDNNILKKYVGVTPKLELESAINSAY